MVQFTKSFVALLFFAGTALATVAQVEADLADLSSELSTLNSLITAYPTTGGTLTGALSIHTHAAALATVLMTTTADVKSTGTESESDAMTILNAVQAVEPTIESALTGIVAKKPAFVALPIGGIPALIKQDLIILSGNASAFATALVDSAPASVKSQATALKAKIASAFANAVAAYA